MISPPDDSGFAAKAHRLARFLPDGKQGEWMELVETMERTMAAANLEYAHLDERNEHLATEVGRLQNMLRRLEQTRDAMENIFQANVRAFDHFRSALRLSRALQGLRELPEIMVRLSQALAVPYVACVLCEEDFGTRVPEPVPTIDRPSLTAALAALPRQSPTSPIFLGTLTSLPHPTFFFNPRLLGPDSPLAGGSCCIASLLDKYQPKRPIGAVIMADPNPERYAPHKGTDFLEHFCEVFAGDLQHVKIHEELIRQRESDELTGIRNRAFLTRHGPLLLAMADRKGSPVSLLFCDLDRFKAINDNYGHAIGDAVLTAVAKAIADRIRDYDVLARLGGDEFVVLLPDAGREQALIMADRIRTAVAEVASNTNLTGSVGLSVSIGLAEHVSGQNISQLIRQADAAMYADKRPSTGT